MRHETHHVVLLLWEGLLGMQLSLFMVTTNGCVASIPSITQDFLKLVFIRVVKILLLS